MDVCIVCHTEFGHVRNREIIYGKNPDGARVGVRNLIKVADRYGAKVSFAVMPEIARYFPKDSGHEIGLHVHSGWKDFDLNGERWCVGDAYLREHCYQSINSMGLKNYPYEEQLDMIRVGKDYLSDLFGVQPRIFVAGCWSLNSDTVRALVKAGFTHDCSPIPHLMPGVYDWSHIKRICLPYHPREDDYQSKGDMPLLIVPTSQTVKGGYASPELAPVLGVPWLKACFKEYYRQNIPLFSMCLHSPSMTDNYYISALDELLKHISRHDVQFRFVSEIEEYPEISPDTSLFPYMLGLNPTLFNTLAKKCYGDMREKLSHNGFFNR